MQLTTHSSGELLEFEITGRLDNDSSEQLTAAINDAVRTGSHSVSLDLSQVEYISSAGIGALLKAHKQLHGLRGYFAISRISDAAAEVIRLTGLAKLLLPDGFTAPSPRASLADTLPPSFQLSVQNGMAYEVYEIRPQATLICDIYGEPNTLPQGTYESADCRPVPFAPGTIGLGLGAFGRDFDDCANRFGEFLSVSGATVQHPTDAAGKPDFQHASGNYVPSIQVLYGLKCTGEFARLIRFERVRPEEPLTLSNMAGQFLKLSRGEAAAMVILGESAGLIGATLRRSPAVAGSAPSRFSHPEIRRWLSFSPNHTHAHTLALTVGVVSRGKPSGEHQALASLLRPLAANTELWGHFHSCVFSYRPFKKRKIELADAVATLFETEDLQAVLHLLHDDRQISGGGESEFVNGACWVGPISQVRTERE